MKFNFYNPVKVLFGAKELEKCGIEAKKLGSRVMIISYQDHDAIKNILSRVEKLISDESIKIIRSYTVQPNPELNNTKKAINLAKSENIDFLLGIGGGSVMDTAKIVAAGVFYEGNIWDMFVYCNDGNVSPKPPKRALPIMLIPTIPATSSEMNSAAVMTNKDSNIKGYIFNELLFPKISIVDPELTISLPNFLTASGGIDAISHNLEPYFNAKLEYPVQFHLEEAVIKTIIELLTKVINNPTNIDLRSHLQWAILVSHNGWTKSGVSYFSSLHMIAHPLSSRFGIHHGATMALIIPAWMRYVYKKSLDKFVRFSEEIFKINVLGKEQEEIAIEGIERFESFIKSMGVPIKINEYENDIIKEEDLDILTEDVVRLGFNSDGYLDGNPILTKEDIYNIYKIAFK